MGIKDSQKLYENIKKARSINTYGSLFFVGVIGFIAYLHLKGVSFSFGTVGSATIIFSLLSVCLAPFIIKSKEATSPKCPRCKGIVEKNKLFGDDLPNNCPNCGLTVEKTKL